MVENCERFAVALKTHLNDHILWPHGLSFPVAEIAMWHCVDNHPYARSFAALEWGQNIELGSLGAHLWFSTIKHNLCSLCEPVLKFS